MRHQQLIIIPMCPIQPLLLFILTTTIRHGQYTHGKIEMKLERTDLDCMSSYLYTTESDILNNIVVEGIILYCLPINFQVCNCAAIDY